MRLKPEHGFAAGVAGWVLLDQVTKTILVHAYQRSGPDTIPLIPGWLDISVLTFNTGAAFGFLRDAHWSRGMFVAIAVVTLLAMLLWRRAICALPWPQRLGLALVAGGAAGNLIDRLFRGGEVVDFIHFHIDSIGFVWPDFNVADIGVTCGMCLYVVHIVVSDLAAARAGKHPAGEPDPEPDAG